MLRDAIIPITAPPNYRAPLGDHPHHLSSLNIPAGGRHCVADAGSPKSAGQNTGSAHFHTAISAGRSDPARDMPDSRPDKPGIRFSQIAGCPAMTHNHCAFWVCLRNMSVLSRKGALSRCISGLAAF
jgi:hypothetical protein